MLSPLFSLLALCSISVCFPHPHPQPHPHPTTPHPLTTKMKMKMNHTVQDSHSDRLTLPKEQIQSLWLAACQPERQSSSQCCDTWQRLVDKTMARLIAYWDPDTNARSDDIHRFDDYEPHWNCINRERIPAVPGDGPKWVCGMDTLKDTALVYSFGSNGETQFEEDVWKRLRTPDIFIFDPTLNRAQIENITRHKSLHFVNSGLTKKDMDHFPARGTKYPARSLDAHMKQLGHSSRRLDILKIDVESSEYRSFQGLRIGDCASADVRVGQLEIELHNPSNLKTKEITVKRLFHSLYSCGMLLFSKERNHWGCHGYFCVEFSFISPSLAFEDFRSVNPTCA